MTTVFDSNFKEILYDFLNSNPLSVISTVGSNSSQPESALIAFAQTQDLEVIFQTQKNTRKHKNLLENPHVSFVIGWDEVKHITVQYEGIAQAVFLEEKQKYITIFRQKKTPCSDEFLLHKDSILYVVKPTWIGYSNYTGSEPLIKEWKVR